MKAIVAAVLAVACLLIASALCGGQPAGQPPRLRVGTFDQQSVVVAYYRSNINLTRHGDMVTAHKTALAVGDTRKARELQKQGADQQALAMEQMLGKAPIDNVIEWTRPLLPDIAAKAGVDAIVVGKVVYPADAEVVSITDQYLAALGADDATRRVIAELKAKKK